MSTKYDTHHNGQKRVQCPDCGRKIREKPRSEPDNDVLCGSCGTRFDRVENRL